MSRSFSRSRHALALALLAWALSASVAGAQSADLRSKMPTSSLAGTTVSHAQTPSDITRALAQERYYSSYGSPEPLAAPVSGDGDGDGIALPLFVLATAGALALGLCAGAVLNTMRARRRQATALAA